MNILSLKRQAQGWFPSMPSNGGDGNHSGSSGGDGSGRGYGGGSSSGGGWTGNRSERDARDAGNLAAGNQDGGPAGNKNLGALGSGMYSDTLSYADIQTMAEENPNQDVPGNPGQTVAQAMASKTVNDAMPYAIGALTHVVPGAGLVVGAVNAAKNNTYGSFFGGLLGGATGVPMGSQIGSMIGNSVQTGKAPNASDVGSMVGGYALGTAGAQLGAKAFGTDGAAGYLGSMAGGLVGSSVGSKLGASIGEGISPSTPGDSATGRSPAAAADPYSGGGWAKPGGGSSGVTMPSVSIGAPTTGAPESAPGTDMRFNLRDAGSRRIASQVQQRAGGG